MRKVFLFAGFCSLMLLPSVLSAQQPSALSKGAWAYFRDVQTKEIHYETFLAPNDKPAIEMNKEKMEKFAPELKKFYFDPTLYKTYLEQVGIQYPMIKAAP